MLYFFMFCGILLTFIKSSEVFISKKRLSLRLKSEADEKHSPLNNILKFLKLKWK